MFVSILLLQAWMVLLEKILYKGVLARSQRRSKHRPMDEADNDTSVAIPMCCQLSRWRCNIHHCHGNYVSCIAYCLISSRVYQRSGSTAIFPNCMIIVRSIASKLRSFCCSYAAHESLLHDRKFFFTLADNSLHSNFTCCWNVEYGFSSNPKGTTQPTHTWYSKIGIICLTHNTLHSLKFSTQSHHSFIML